MSRWRDTLLPAAAVALLTAAAMAQTGQATAPEPAQPQALRAEAATTSAATGPRLGLGREARPEEIAGWDIAVRPDGKGLPPGKGTVKDGEAVFMERCATCHGEFGESAGRWPILAGGAGTLTSDSPVKSIASYWPYASTVIDYIRRAMPFGNAQSLTNDELYAVTAYVLYLNDVIKDEDFELNQANFTSIKLPNEPRFFDDDRQTSESEFWNRQPCMANCAPGEARITSRARALDVTPEEGKGPKVE